MTMAYLKFHGKIRFRLTETRQFIQAIEPAISNDQRKSRKRVTPEKANIQILANHARSYLDI